MLKLLGLSLLMALFISFSASATNLQAAEELVENAIYESDLLQNTDSKIEINLIKGRKEIDTASSDILELTNIEFDERRKTFTGFILNGTLIPIEISGKYSEIMEIPAVNRKVRRDEIITRADISFVEIDSEKLDRGYLTEAEDLIGKSPVRTLFKNRPVMPKQIAAPTLVKKKQAVTMIYKNNLLEMQDIGVAMEDGSQGELIRIRNQNSNIIINARVISDNLVEVETGGKLMAFNN